MPTMNTPLRYGLPRAALILGLALVLGGCASTTAPVVYSSKSQQVTAPRAQADVEQCRRAADAAVGVNGAKAPRTAGNAARRGAVRFVDQAVESLVEGSRNAWAKARGAGAGATAGSLMAVLLSWDEPDAVYREHVEICLKERGHKVLGWR
jgi:hypothetical protein